MIVLGALVGLVLGLVGIAGVLAVCVGVLVLVIWCL